jgi:hypothetical protein
LGKGVVAVPALRTVWEVKSKDSISQQEMQIETSAREPLGCLGSRGLVRMLARVGRRLEPSYTGGSVRWYSHLGEVWQ